MVQLVLTVDNMLRLGTAERSIHEKSAQNKLVLKAIHAGASKETDYFIDKVTGPHAQYYNPAHSSQSRHTQ
jgi:hypothetical protein